MHASCQCSAHTCTPTVRRAHLHQVRRHGQRVGVGGHHVKQDAQAHAEDVCEVARVHDREDLGKVLAELLALAAA